MKDEGKTLTGWPAVRMVLMLAFTPVLTALVMSLPITWLVNRVFTIGAIHAIFGVERLGYAQDVCRNNRARFVIRLSLFVRVHSLQFWDVIEP